MENKCESGSLGVVSIPNTKYDEDELYKGLLLQNHYGIYSKMLRPSYHSAKPRGHEGHVTGDDLRYRIFPSSAVARSRYVDMPSQKGNVRGTVVPSDNSNHYTGKTLNGTCHGFGCMHYSDRVYEGMWENGKKRGEGKMIYNDGSTESGIWEDDKIVGPSKVEGLRISERARYSGTTCGGKPDGDGSMQFDNDPVCPSPPEISRIIGKWKDGKLQDGECIITYTNGWSYIGVHIGMKRNGHGTMIHDLYTMSIHSQDIPKLLDMPNVTSLTGSWRDDKEDGKMCYKTNGWTVAYTATTTNTLVDGEIDYGSGRLYKGQIEVDRGSYVFTQQRSGHGIQTEKGLVIYSGGWKNDKYNGVGKLTAYDSVYSGVFEDGRLNGIGTRVLNNGGKYEGFFANGLYHGKGKYVNPSGEIYDGEWCNGERRGFGKTILASGEVWIGNHVLGLLHSTSGEKRFVDGRRLIGDWRDGEFCDCSFTLILDDQREVCGTTYSDNTTLKFYDGGEVKFIRKTIGVDDVAAMNEKSLVAISSSTISIFMDGRIDRDEMTEDTTIDRHFLWNRKVYAGLRKIRNFAEEGRVNARFDCQICCIFETIPK